MRLTSLNRRSRESFTVAIDFHGDCRPSLLPLLSCRDLVFTLCESKLRASGFKIGQSPILRLILQRLQMAESVPKQSTESKKAPENVNKLKHLGFVQEAAIYAIVFFSGIYQYAKENSGPLKPGVQTVEDTVKTVIGPVYEKFHDVPVEFLQFVDRKVDECLAELNEHVPSLFKQASKKAIEAVHKAPEVAGMVAAEYQRVGVVDATKNISQEVYVKYEPAAKELYAKYEPVAEQYAGTIWRGLHRLPLFPQVAHIVTPTAAYWSEKYNQAVGCSSETGCAMASHLPLIPIDRIAKVFGGDGEAVAVGQS